jgi:pyridoxine 5-phosphate synthase
MARLSVNINKIATLRNARGGNNPDLLAVAADCERFGAQGITIHPRPDQRHIRYADAHDLKQIVRTELNMEGYPDESFLALVCAVQPTQCTLVPDAPQALTSNSGWDTKTHLHLLTDVVARLHAHGIRTSIFVDTNPQNIEYAAKIHTDCIELYTEPYAQSYEKNAEIAIENYISAHDLAHSLSLKINAGHDLNLQNLQYFAQNLPHLHEVSIGHALICDALYFGLENTINLYKKQLQPNL